MDTIFFQQALDRYRSESHDNRSFADLPVDVQSRIVLSAQALKKDATAMESWIKRKKEAQ